jgi:hypothetical protein
MLVLTPAVSRSLHVGRQTDRQTKLQPAKPRRTPQHRSCRQSARSRTCLATQATDNVSVTIAALACLFASGALHLLQDQPIVQKHALHYQSRARNSHTLGTLGALGTSSGQKKATKESSKRVDALDEVVGGVHSDPCARARTSPLASADQTGQCSVRPCPHRGSTRPAHRATRRAVRPTL